MSFGNNWHSEKTALVKLVGVHGTRPSLINFIMEAESEGSVKKSEVFVFLKISCPSNIMDLSSTAQKWHLKLL